MAIKSNFLGTIRAWLKNILSESISKAVSNLFSRLLTWIILVILAALFYIVVPNLQKPLDIPLYIFLILCLLSTFGLLTIINTAFKNRQIHGMTKRLIDLKFEDFPRVWKNYCIYNGFEWRNSGSLRVYCSKHNLELHPTYLGNYLVTICPDCRKDENVNPKEYCHSAIIIHCNWEHASKFYDEVRSRILRECVNRDHKN